MKKKIIILVSIVLIGIISIICWKVDKNIKSNVQSLLERISKENIFDKVEIEIFKTIDKGPLLFVGYEIKEKPCAYYYAVLEKNKNGTYSLYDKGTGLNMDRRIDRVFTKYDVYVNENNENFTYMMLLNLNENPRVCKMTANNQSEETIYLDTIDFTVIEYPSGGGINFGFYDLDGNVLME